MLILVLKMSAVTAIYVVLTAFLWKITRKRKLTLLLKLLIGLIYGGCAILSTHFGVDYSHMLLNVRDLGPLSAGLFFDPLSGIVAGLVGGIERYIAGTYWGVGSYTRIACSVSTCLAGMVAALLHVYIFKRKRPTAAYAFFMGSVMEVFHMYVVFITHRDDMEMAFYVVRICAPPMILFSGLGLAASSILIKILSGEWENPLVKPPAEKITVAQRFQRSLFAVSFVILALNLLFTYTIQTQTALQNAREQLTATTGDIHRTFDTIQEIVSESNSTVVDFSYFHVGSSGTYDVFLDDGSILVGSHEGTVLTEEEMRILIKTQDQIFSANLFHEEAMCRVEKLLDGLYLLTRLPVTEVYAARDAQVYESAFSAIILFAVTYVLISMLVNGIVVSKLQRINKSLDRISQGNLDEVVNVRDSLEFASLSDDINETVGVLKGYIDAEKKRMEEELEFARTIQDSALPKNFTFTRDDFEIYATMDPAKEVGGDFYDFFFTDRDKIALVIADVSGK
ncbi:MAG: LytS/YhcK type 5TM receptor domain-containing protein, partial [bacterium]